MNYLLDTHTFLWAVFEPEKLSEKARSIVIDPQHNIFISSISFWEISLKSSMGKLELVGCKPDELPDIAEQMGIEHIGLEADVAAGFYKLPKKAHKDPFDRMIAWMAIKRKFVLVTKDSQLDIYAQHGLKTVW